MSVFLRFPRYPEVFTMEEQSEDEEELWNGLKEALEGAFGQFVETRKAEGENLKKDILSKLDSLEKEICIRGGTLSPDRGGISGEAGG